MTRFESGATRRGDALQTLTMYDTVFYRVALRPKEGEAWTIHSLVLDVMPAIYVERLEGFPGYYTPAAFCYHYPTAAFIAGKMATHEVLTWFDTSQEHWLAVPGGDGYSTRSFTLWMPDLQPDVSVRHHYYSPEPVDGFSLLRWPHTIYTFSRAVHTPHFYDPAALVAEGCPPYPDFDLALASLIYGELDWNKVRMRSSDPQIALRVVREQPYISDIETIDNRTVVASVQGLNFQFTSRVTLMGSGGAHAEEQVMAPGAYSLTLKQDLPPQGRLTLISDSTLLDEYEWNTTYNPLPRRPAASVPPGATAAADSARAIADKRAAGEFDVFLCHHGLDKAQVKLLGKQLMQHGILPWLDEWELQPGLPWIPELERRIGQVRAAAICVGASGIGPWQEEEISALLVEYNKRGCPVIPVILPDCTTPPDFPAFLGARHWVDFRRSDPDPLRQLIWGITGERPTDL